MMKLKNKLDEMQEQELLKIEHNGCWLAFWLLFISIIVQIFIYGSFNYRALAGELVIFIILGLYLAIACIRKGIWDRHLPMNTKANLILSLIASLTVGGLNCFFRGVNNFQKPVGALAFAVISAATTFTICIVALTVLMKTTQKKKNKLDAEPADTIEL